jgi:hypothetical protein
MLPQNGTALPAEGRGLTVCWDRRQTRYRRPTDGAGVGALFPAVAACGVPGARTPPCGSDCGRSRDIRRPQAPAVAAFVPAWPRRGWASRAGSFRSLIGDRSGKSIAAFDEVFWFWPVPKQVSGDSTPVAPGVPIRVHARGRDTVTLPVSQSAGRWFGDCCSRGISVHLSDCPGSWADDGPVQSRLA